MSALIESYFEKIEGIAGPALTDISGETRRELTGKELLDLIDRTAGDLASRGIQTGDSVIAVFDNRLEAAVLLLTALRHGICLCIQAPSTSPEDLKKIRNQVGAHAILNTAAQEIDGTVLIDLSALNASATQVASDVPPQTPFTITFTSGSTGTPKGIVHGAESFLACAHAFNKQTGISSKDRFLNTMPMFYMAGIFNGILAPLAAGAPVVITENFNTATAMRFWPMIEAEAITALWLSPTMLSLVMKLDRTDKKLPESFRRLFVGTGAMPKTDAELFQDTYGLPPLQSYGLSELLYISVDNATAPGFGTVGEPLENVTLTLDEAGVLTIGTAYAFQGYLVEGALMPHQGDFITSDLAAINANGRLTILGRSDDIIVRGGVNVNPMGLEKLLAPLLEDIKFCVAGLPDPTLGQRVVLVTQGTIVSRSTFERAKTIVRQHPGQYQLDGTLSVAHLPVGPTGKIRRHDLTHQLLEMAGA